MADESHIPTRAGDVVVLKTGKLYPTWAVGRVLTPSQRAFEGLIDVQYPNTREAAMAAADTLLRPGSRLFLRNIDTGEWEQLTR